MIYDPLADIVVCDVETTGFSSKSDEVLSLTAVNGHGEILFDGMFKPERKTSWLEATKVNGITPAMVRNCLPFKNSLKRLQATFAGKNVLFYNANFDQKFLEDELLNANSIFCVMQAFANFYREPKSKKSNYNKGLYEWKKLEFAMQHFGLRFKGDPHTSKADTLATLDVFLSLVKEGRETIYKVYGDKPNPHAKSDFVFLDTLAYVDMKAAHIVGVAQNQTVDDAIKLMRADYPDPTKIMLCRKKTNHILEPIYFER